MGESTSSIKKVAVLTGLTMLVGGAEIYEADAATVSQTDTFLLTQSVGGGSISQTQVLNFLGFNSALGTLTAVHYSLDSLISTGGFLFVPDATVAVDSQVFAEQTSAGNFDFASVPAPDSLSNYGSPFGVTLSMTAICESSCTMTWRGTDGEAGLTVEYDYTPAETNPTPLPAALPLFVTGLAGLGTVAMRSRRRKSAKA